MTDLKHSPATSHSSDVDTLRLLLHGFTDDTPIKEVREMLDRQFGTTPSHVGHNCSRCGVKDVAHCPLSTPHNCPLSAASTTRRSKTPRTDAAAFPMTQEEVSGMVVDVTFARQLERELERVVALHKALMAAADKRYDDLILSPSAPSAIAPKAIPVPSTVKMPVKTFDTYYLYDSAGRELCTGRASDMEFLAACVNAAANNRADGGKQT